MKTNEEIKRQLLVQAEIAIEQLVEELEVMQEGDLACLEQVIMRTVLELGRQGMATILAQKSREDQLGEPGEDRSGHRLRLVGYRERQVVTLMGRITITRGYDHCEEAKSSKENEKPLPACAGVAPFDRRWGLRGSHASPGVQRVLAKLSARLTHEEVAEAVADVLRNAAAALIGEIKGDYSYPEQRGTSYVLREGEEQAWQSKTLLSVSCKRYSTPAWR